MGRIPLRATALRWLAAASALGAAAAAGDGVETLCRKHGENGVSYLKVDNGGQHHKANPDQGTKFCQCRRGHKAYGPGAIDNFDYGPWPATKGFSLFPLACAKCGCSERCQPTSVLVERPPALPPDPPPNCPAGGYACSKFFTVIATLPTDFNTSSCFELANFVAELDVMSRQMVRLRSTLVVFVSRHRLCGGGPLDGEPVTSPYPSSLTCGFTPPPRIEIRLFNPAALLTLHNMTDQKVHFMRMQGKDHVGLAQLSDVLRILLAIETGYAYLDKDVLFLSASRDDFLCEFMAACVWPNLEITNSAFCLAPQYLYKLKDFIFKTLAEHDHDTGGNGKKFAYTEIGPGAFSHVLPNGRQSPRLMTQNHPHAGKLQQIAEGYEEYHHRHLHLTGTIRKIISEDAEGPGKGGNYEDITRAVLTKLKLPPL